MASEETAGAAQPGDGKDETPGAVALNPGGVPIRGIKMKFGVLAGLLEVGEVSNRDIVETVFNLWRLRRSAMINSARPRGRAAGLGYPARGPVSSCHEDARLYGGFSSAGAEAGAGNHSHLLLE
ncbi:Lipopolysaccharide-responsive and beige-like anchor protein [Liparis tanakae]|uniref:Lipopolysaccharide-responsive and beige-like anchor protein n=1 Tax=Liparis tanakae TaxID=230148 RepID=A0A4Z2JIX0_9TELE|nr:Lipopolysaccharide-responsive and beige-like anchor protein [Liparis tanakae]